ncbi:putative ribonuclease H-like domain-containing protein [Tanacetum coccineum]
MQEELLQFKLQKVWTLVDLPKGKRVIGTKWVYKNKKDGRGIVVRNKARLVAQGYTQEEGIDYDKVFAHIARIEAIRLFLAYASFMGLIVYQMDVKSAFLYGTIKEEVYVCQPPGFEDPQFPDKKVDTEEALLIKLCSSRRTEVISWELTFFLGLQVQQKEDGIFISQDKYVANILKKFDFTTVKAASTLIETNKALNKDEEAENVDVHLYRSMIGSLMYLTASRPDIMFVVCACARFQVTLKVSHLNVVKRIFRYFKGQPKLGFWYPRDSPFDLESFSDSDYAGASLDRKSTIRDETVYKEWEDRMERVATTVSSLEAEQDSGNIDRTQSMVTLNEYFPQGTGSGSGPRVNTLGSRENSMKLMELMEHCTKLSELKKCSKKKDKGKAIMKEAEPVQKKTKLQLEQERLGLEEALRLQEQLDEEERQRIARVHEEASTFNAKEWDNIQAQIEADEELAHRLQAQEREGYSEADKARLLVELINERKRKLAQQRAAQRRNNPMTQAQQRTYMCNYIKHVGSHTLQQLKKLSFDEIDVEQELNQESSKRQKIGEGSEPAEESKDELSQEQLQQLMIIVLEEGMNIFEDMLKNFDRDDLVKLWSLVHERFNSTEPTKDKERELWVDLKRFFEPDDDDILWKLQSFREE